LRTEANRSEGSELDHFGSNNRQKVRVVPEPARSLALQKLKNKNTGPENTIIGVPRKKSILSPATTLVSLRKQGASLF